MSLQRKPGSMIRSTQLNTLRKRPKGQGKIAKLGWFSKSRRTQVKHKGK